MTTTTTGTAPTDDVVTTADDVSDERCSICLEKFEQPALVDQCFHRFCLTCIHEWGTVSRTCPLCKSPFTSLIYDVKSDSDYKRLFVEPKEREKPKRETRRWGGQQWRDHPQPSQDNARFRRTVYTRRLRPVPWERSVFQKIRNLEPEMARGESELRYRIRPWVQRDLRAIFFPDEDVALLTDFILSLVSDSQCGAASPRFRELLLPFLGGDTDTFVSELKHFVVSPFHVVGYDTHVRYKQPRGPSFHAVPPPGDLAASGAWERLVGDGFDSDSDDERRRRKRHKSNGVPATSLVPRQLRVRRGRHGKHDASPFDLPPGERAQTLARLRAEVHQISAEIEKAMKRLDELRGKP